MQFIDLIYHLIFIFLFLSKLMMMDIIYELQLENGKLCGIEFVVKLNDHLVAFDFEPKLIKFLIFHFFQPNYNH
jgi:hypothetical protein